MGLFTKKSLDELRAEADRGLLRRSPRPVDLTALGIGLIIGTGIFGADGHGRVAECRACGARAVDDHLGRRARVRRVVLRGVRRDGAGGGSAYTYAYATAGELVAWIIGWDLILEYALSTATVAVGWSGYFVSLAADVGVVIPQALAGAPGGFNLPAAIVALVAGLLIVGVKQSADTNTLLVAIKTLVLVVFVVAGASYVTRAHLTPFIPPNTGVFGEFGVERRAARRRRDVLRVHRVRCGVDSGAGSQ